MKFLKAFWKENKAYIKALAVLLMLFATINAASAVPTGGSAYYPFNEGSGTTLNDVWSNMDITMDTISFTTDVPILQPGGVTLNYSIDLNADDTGYTTKNLFGDSSSISMWIKKDGNPLSAERIFDSYTKSVYNLGSLTNGSFIFTIYDSTDSTTKSVITPAIDPDEWNLITINIGNNNISIFLNETLIQESDGFADYDTEDGFTLGSRRYLSLKDWKFDGFISNFQVFNKTLSYSEISNLVLYGDVDYGSFINNFSIDVYDAWNSVLITNVWAYINGTNYTNSTGSTIKTNITSNITYLLDIIVGGENHTSRWYNDTNSTSGLDAFLYPENSVNITFKYEDTYEVANDTNISAAFISSVYSTVANTTTGYLNLTLPYPETYQIRYQASGYSPRFYTFTLVNGTYNELELLLPSTTSQNVTIYVKDTLGNPLEDATVKVLKYFVSLNSYVQVASVVTNFEGRIVESMDVGTEFYQFIIEYGGNTVLTTTPSYIYDTTLTLYVNLIGDVFSELFTLTGLYGIITYTPNITFTYTYDDKDNLATQGCLYAYRVSFNTETLVNSSCGTGAAGTVNVTVTNTTGFSYVFKGYITKDGTSYYVTNFYYTYGEGFEEDGNGILLVIVLILTFALIGFWRLEASVIFAGFSLLLVSIIGFVNIPVTYTAGVFVLSLVAAYLISKRSGAA